MNKSAKIAKIALFTIYFLLLTGITSKLFFEKQFDEAWFSIFSRDNFNEANLTIGFSEPFISLSPLAFDNGSRQRTSHIYEALVSVDPDLQIKPGLAISYGVIDDLTWEFRLRPGIFFHNGKPLTLDDVLFSLQNSISGVKEIKEVNHEVFQIITNSPDPLLLSKLALVFIYPKDNSLNIPIGTGPYMFIKNENGDVVLKRSEKYWGDKAVFENVVLKTFKSKEEKVSALKDGTVDIVASVPVEHGRDFKYSKFELATLPSLEVNFLMFNFNGIFKNRALREAVSYVLKIDELAKLTRGFAAPVPQFVGNGIFGFDPQIKLKEYDLEKAKRLVGETKIKTTLDLPLGLEVFGKKVKEQLEKAGFDVILRFSSLTRLSKKIVQGESEFFFFGWKSDLGDSADFLINVVHSREGNFGAFNGANYSNKEVDDLIELSQKTVESAKRLGLLRQVMRKITLEDIIGVPLFSPEILYGVSKRIKWNPRVDGLILAREVKM